VQKAFTMLNEGDPTTTGNDALPVIGAASFRAEVLDSRLPVLVEFCSPWSRPCQVSDSVLQEIAREWAGKIKVVKVNADDSLDLRLGYEIRFVPTLLYFVHGKPRERIVGTASKEAILAKLEPFSK
jgi:thioredoxin-like negative regulator of GroEL